MAQIARDFVAARVGEADPESGIEFGLVVHQRCVRAGFEQNAVGVVIAKVIQAGGLGGVGKVDASCRAGFGNFTTGDGDFVIENACA